VLLNKFYWVACGITTNAMESICIGINSAAWFIIFVKGAFYLVIPVGFEVVMLQNCKYRKPLFVLCRLFP
jgi:hypothetical protein